MKKILVLLTASLILVGCGAKGDSISDNLINENPSEIHGDFVNLSDSSFTEMSGTTEDEEIDEDSISDQGISENQPEAVEQSQVDLTPATDPVYVQDENNKMYVANLSGVDIDKLFVSMNVGNLNNTEILGFDDLYDGNSFEYSIDDIDTLKQAGIIKLKVNILTRKGASIDFGEIEVIDPTGIKLILAWNLEDGYYMYLE